MTISDKDRKRYERLSQRWACKRKLSRKEMLFVFDMQKRMAQARMSDELSNYKAS